eukprot:TRINITY_DN73532_c0_g1_i1.p1 TRINITY_DN73532_c0_g1~~TRINITY_DN73532_c0_g1_i1.p1  ORF type:complete len:814 (+),score=179.84 TRINITY_DN73532_c0_g1_i1:64-2442(+)
MEAQTCYSSSKHGRNADDNNTAQDDNDLFGAMLAAEFAEDGDEFSRVEPAAQKPEDVVVIEHDTVLPHMLKAQEPEGMVAIKDNESAVPILTLESLVAVTASAFPRVIDIFHKMDIHHDGRIALEEFVTALQRCFPGACKANIAELFHYCDINGNGTVVLSELHKRFRNLKNKKINAPEMGQKAQDHSDSLMMEKSQTRTPPTAPSGSPGRPTKEQAADMKDTARQKKSEDEDGLDFSASMDKADMLSRDLSHEKLDKLGPVKVASVVVSEDHENDSAEQQNEKGEDSLKFKRFSCVRWHEQTNSSVQTAKALVRQASSHIEAQLEDSSKPRRRNGDDDEKVSIVRITMQKRLGMQDSLLKALAMRCESVEATIRQAGECFHSLQRAARAQTATLSVCEMRLKLREKRPLKELVRDDCQIVLEQHRDAVISGRDELDQRASRMKEMLHDLDSTWERLLEDMQSRRHALRVDKQLRQKDHQVPGTPRATRGLPSLPAVAPAMLAAGHRSLRSPPQSEDFSGSGCVVLPQLPGSPASQQMSTSPPGSAGIHTASGENRFAAGYAGEQIMSDAVKLSPRATPRKVGREQNVKDEGILAHKSYDQLKATTMLEEEALLLVEEAKGFIVKLQQKLDMCGHEATKFLKIRVRELLRLKTSVENQLTETDRALYAMQLTYDRAKRELRAHQEPLKAAINQQVLAKRGRKDAADGGTNEMALLVEQEMKDITDRMQTHVDELDRKVRATGDLLDQLKASRAALKEDQKNKLQCQKIDAGCLQMTYKKVAKVTPRSAAQAS